MKKSYSISNIIVGLLLMSTLVLIVLGAFHCKKCDPLKPYHYYYNPNTLTQENYSIEILGHRLYNAYLNRNVRNLDYSNNFLYPDSMITDIVELLSHELFGNTHSESKSSERSTDSVDDLRRDILKFLGTSISKYTVIFTYSNGQALKTFIEAFPFNSSSTFAYSSSSHNDILGLRYLAQKKSSALKSFKFNTIDQDLSSLSSTGPNLAVFPLLDLFDGTILTNDEMKKALSISNIYTLADASHYLMSRRLNLTELPFSAVTLSFEHLFGYPKLGVLVLNNDLVDKLQKPYFGGGTLVYALPSKDVVKMRLRPSERYEDGSLPFLNIAAVSSGFKLMETLKWENVHDHIKNMTKKVIQILNEEGKYSDGTKGVVIYGDKQESIVSFNIIDKTSQKVVQFDKYFNIARRNNVRIAVGCHQTPGTCLKALNIDESTLYDKVSTLNMSSYGSLRVSVGWATIESDIDFFRQLIKFYFRDENVK